MARMRLLTGLQLPPFRNVPPPKYTRPMSGGGMGPMPPPLSVRGLHDAHRVSTTRGSCAPSRRATGGCISSPSASRSKKWLAVRRGNGSGVTVELEGSGFACFPTLQPQTQFPPARGVLQQDLVTPCNHDGQVGVGSGASAGPDRGVRSVLRGQPLLLHLRLRLLSARRPGPIGSGPVAAL